MNNVNLITPHSLISLQT